MWNFSKILKISFGVVAVVCVISFWTVVSYYAGKEIVSDNSGMESESLFSDESCNVAGINLHGDIVTYHTNDAYDDQGNLMYDQTSSDEVAWFIEEALANDNIKAIVVDVDSYGGSPVAAEEIANDIKNSKKPVFAYIRDVGLSAAYWAVSGADKIFASKNSDVGSIGITSSYVSNAEKNKKDGLTFVDLSSAKYKDSGTPDKVLTAEERALFLRDINIMHENFIEAVASNRKLATSTVKSIADGSSVLGMKAKELGLIDEIGGPAEVEKYLQTKIGVKPEICWGN